MSKQPINISMTDDRQVEVDAYVSGHAAFGVHAGVDSEGNALRLNGWRVTHRGTGYHAFVGRGHRLAVMRDIARGLDLITRALGDHTSKKDFVTSPSGDAAQHFIRNLNKSRESLLRPANAPGCPTRGWYLDRARDAVAAAGGSRS